LYGRQHSPQAPLCRGRASEWAFTSWRPEFGWLVRGRLHVMTLASAGYPPLPAAARRAAHPRSIASHLALLCVAVAIPILACVSVVLWRYAVTEQRQLEGRGVASVR